MPAIYQQIATFGKTSLFGHYQKFSTKNNYKNSLAALTGKSFQ